MQLFSQTSAVASFESSSKKYELMRWMPPENSGFRPSKIGVRRQRFHVDGIDLAVQQGPPLAGAALELVCLLRNEVIAVCSLQLLGNAPLPPDARAMARLPNLHAAHDLWPAFERSADVPSDNRGPCFSQTTPAIDAALAD